MDRYQLGKLVQWAGPSLKTRKRMQKVVYLLKAAGCPIDADFFLHHYGPYSTELAQLTDELVRNGMLVERATSNPRGQQFEYSLAVEPGESLSKYEETPAGMSALALLRPYESRAQDLLRKDVSELEHASTVAFFKSQGESWDEALSKACSFKRLEPQGAAATAALALAQAVMEPPD